MLIVDLPDPSKIPALAEPWFSGFEADVEFHVVMTPDDLKKAGIACQPSQLPPGCVVHPLRAPMKFLKIFISCYKYSYNYPLSFSSPACRELLFIAIRASTKWRASSNMTRSKNRIISKLACGVRTSNTASKDSSLSDQSLCLKKSGQALRQYEENTSPSPLQHNPPPPEGNILLHCYCVRA